MAEKSLPIEALHLTFYKEIELTKVLYMATGSSYFACKSDID